VLRVIDFQLASQRCTLGDACPDNIFFMEHGLPPIPPVNVSFDVC
jgi:hypothetical protein